MISRAKRLHNRHGNLGQKAGRHCISGRSDGTLSQHQKKPICQTLLSLVLRTVSGPQLKALIPIVELCLFVFRGGEHVALFD
jgi:hypothetical protein